MLEGLDARFDLARARIVENFDEELSAFLRKVRLIIWAKLTAHLQG